MRMLRALNIWNKWPATVRRMGSLGNAFLREKSSCFGEDRADITRRRDDGMAIDHSG